MTDSIEKLKQAVDRFADDRKWEQFHSPKNLAMALIVEAGELVEHFQWLSQEQSLHLDTQKKSAVAEEMADVFIYLVRMASRLEIDLLDATAKKLIVNARKYPVSKAAGRADKYTAYGTDK